MTVKAVAFYLPQYHPTPENDAFWGKGFSEWRHVAKARPLFPGHYQPHIPGELGFYDLRLVEVQREQAALATRYGLFGFCYYYYWFAGRRVLDRPLMQMHVTKDIDLPFCVCWANENWTRRWDGRDDDVLLAQAHSPEDDRAFIASLLPFFADPRYIKVDGRPLLLVYRVALFPEMPATAERWRQAAKAAGHPDLFLALVQFDQDQDPRPYGFDAAVEFPPHHFLGRENVLERPAFYDPACQATLIDYRRVVGQALDKRWPEHRWFRGVMPSWDNTPRRPQSAHVFLGSSPAGYHQWLYRVAQETIVRAPPAERFVFINAWNEWGEGCHLEPDLRYGKAYLEATQAALRGEAQVALADPPLDARTEQGELSDETQARERSLLALEREVRRQHQVILEQETRVWDGTLRSAARLVLNRHPSLKRAAKRVLRRP